MSYKSKVSVIIPVYNSERYLRECLDSVINQTLRDIEIICVNDGSTDSSLSILNEYAEKDKRLRVLNQENAGAGAARNAGLKVAGGEYLSFLDADDFFAPTMLEEMYNRCLEDEADIGICKVWKYDDISRKREFAYWAFVQNNIPAAVSFSYKDMPEHIFNTFQNWTWNKLFKRSFIAENKLYFQNIRRTNDLLFTCLALVRARKITLIDKELVYYRVNTQTSSQSTNDAAPLDFYRAFFALKESLVKIGIFSEVEKSFVNHALGGCLYNLRSLKTNEAKKILYNKLREEYFSELGIAKFPKEYFYIQSEYRQHKRIMATPYSGYKKNDRQLFLLADQFMDVCKREGLKAALGRAKNKLTGMKIK